MRLSRRRSPRPRGARRPTSDRLTATDFATPGTVYQMGLPPFRIDILTGISGVGYDEAAADVTTGRLGSELVRFIGLEAMIRNKRATGRTKDLADAEALEQIRARIRPRR